MYHGPVGRGQGPSARARNRSQVCRALAVHSTTDAAIRLRGSRGGTRAGLSCEAWRPPPRRPITCEIWRCAARRLHRLCIAAHAHGAACGRGREKKKMGAPADARAPCARGPSASPGACPGERRAARLTACNRQPPASGHGRTAALPSRQQRRRCGQPFESVGQHASPERQLANPTGALPRPRRSLAFPLAGGRHQVRRGRLAPPSPKSRASSRSS